MKFMDVLFIILLIAWLSGVTVFMLQEVLFTCCSSCAGRFGVHFVAGAKAV